MAIFSGSLGFTRYRVEGALPKDIRTDFEAALRKHAFETFREGDAREETVGWVTADNLFDVDLSPDRWLDENCVRLTLRADRRRVPGRMLRHECEQIEESWKVKFARERLTRPEKDQIKEMVTAKLIERALPDAKGTDLYWDLDRAELYFFATGEKQNETFTTLFEKTFGLKLSAVFPFSMALNFLDEAGKKAAETVAETAFAPERK